MKSKKLFAIPITLSNEAKGVFSLIIVLLHVYPLFCTEVSLLRLIISRLVKMSLFGFLFFSGYGCMKSFEKKGLTRYWENKISKIYFPAFLANIIGLVIGFFIEGTNWDRDEILRSVLLFDPDSKFNMFLWYLHFLLLWYFCFWVIYYLLSDNFKLRVVAWILVALLVWYFAPQHYVWGLANDYWSGFIIGILYAKFSEEKVEEHKINIFKFVVSVCIFVMIFFVVLHMDSEKLQIFNRSVNFYIHTAIYNLLLAILFGLFLYILYGLVSIFKSVKVGLDYLGDISYYIYILHCPLLAYPINNMEKYNARLIMLGVGLAGLFLVCILFRYIFDIKREK